MPKRETAAWLIASRVRDEQEVAGYAPRLDRENTSEAAVRRPKSPFLGKSKQIWVAIFRVVRILTSTLIRRKGCQMPEYKSRDPEVTTNYYGEHPSHYSNESHGRPVCYVGSESDQYGSTGYGAGIGLNNTKDLEAVQVNGHAGTWQDLHGERQTGVEVDGSFIQGGGEVTDGLELRGGVLTANAGMKMNDSTTSVGLGANAAEVEGTVGNEEHSVRGGVSAGLSAGARTHYGDADNDGVRELGFGADIGPVSFDVKSEWLGRAWNWIAD